MTPQLYLEFDSDLQVASFEEWAGREYARHTNEPAYPIAPDSWTGPPEVPPIAAYTWFYTRCSRKIVCGTLMGGVCEVPDGLLVFANQPQTLSNGSVYNFDVHANLKTFEQLTPEGQLAIAPPDAVTEPTI